MSGTVTGMWWNSLKKTKIIIFLKDIHLLYKVRISMLLIYQQLMSETAEETVKIKISDHEVNL